MCLISMRETSVDKNMKVKLDFYKTITQFVQNHNNREMNEMREISRYLKEKDHKIGDLYGMLHILYATKNIGLQQGTNLILQTGMSPPNSEELDTIVDEVNIREPLKRSFPKLVEDLDKLNLKDEKSFYTKCFLDLVHNAKLKNDIPENLANSSGKGITKFYELVYKAFHNETPK